jgi:hypothetical protein
MTVYKSIFILLQIVLKYQKLINNLEKLIELSGLEDNYLAQKIGLKQAAFLLKKQKAKWTISELLILIPIIENKQEADDSDILKMRKIKKGVFVTSAEFEKRMNWK